MKPSLDPCFFLSYCRRHRLPGEELLSRYFFLFEEGAWQESLWQMLMAEPKIPMPGLYYYRETCRPKPFFTALRDMAHRWGAEYDGVCLCAFICLAEKTKQLYEALAIPLDVFEATFTSLALWAQKHRTMTGEWGLSEDSWCVKYLAAELFRLGELEYQPCENCFGSRYGLSEGQILVRIHIPAGAEFSPAARRASYQAAYRFFAPRLGMRSLTFVCESWLLAKDHPLFLKTGNIASFREDFTILEEYSDDDRGFLWRIFGKGDVNHPGELPENNRLQKLYREKLLRGDPFYSASGIFTMEEEDKEQWKK